MFRVKLVAELSQLAEEDEVVPHAVQLISPPFLGRTVLTAGPAKFGMDLSKQEHGVSNHFHKHFCFPQWWGTHSYAAASPVQVKGSISKASPYTACSPVHNAPQLKGRIALALRGDCMFAVKARRLQEAGATGVIIIGELSEMMCESALDGPNQWLDSK